jgi:hypothetical protein
MVMRVCRVCGEKFGAGADVDYCCAAHRQVAYRNRLKLTARPVAVPTSVEEKLALIARLVAEVRELITDGGEADHPQGVVAAGWAPSRCPDGIAKSVGAESV